MSRWIQVAVAAVMLLVVGMLFSTCAHAEVTNKQFMTCVNKETWKAIGTGAAYGAGVGFLASGVAVITAPAGAIIAPVGFILTNTLYGGLLGTGSSASTMIYIGAKTEDTPFRMVCLKQAVVDAAKDASKAVGL